MNGQLFHEWSVLLSSLVMWEISFFPHRRSFNLVYNWHENEFSNDQMISRVFYDLCHRWQTNKAKLIWAIMSPISHWFLSYTWTLTRARLGVVGRLAVVVVPSKGGQSRQKSLFPAQTSIRGFAPSNIPISSGLDFVRFGFFGGVDSI